MWWAGSRCVLSFCHQCPISSALVLETFTAPCLIPCLFMDNFLLLFCLFLYPLAHTFHTGSLNIITLLPSSPPPQRSVFIKVLLASTWWMYTTAAWSELRDRTYTFICLYGHFPTSPPPHWLLALILPRPRDFPEWLHKCKNAVKFSRQAFQEKLLSYVNLCSWVLLCNRSGHSASICRHTKQWVLWDKKLIQWWQWQWQDKDSAVVLQEQGDIRTFGGYWQVDSNC